MKKYMIALAALAALATTADAACTRKDLNGTWVLAYAGTGGLGIMAGGSFSASIGSTPVTFTVTSYSSSKCKGTGIATVGSTTLTDVRFATEQISSSSSRKPNHLIFSGIVSGTTYYQLILQRR